MAILRYSIYFVYCTDRLIVPLDLYNVQDMQPTDRGGALRGAPFNDRRVHSDARDID